MIVQGKVVSVGKDEVLMEVQKVLAFAFDGKELYRPYQRHEHLYENGVP